MILHHQMVSSEKKLANAMGGKTARACDSCIIKRARWYCAADDVLLCQFCDASVHSANPLARGHERVCLNLASLKRSSSEIPPLTWQQGFKKKPRTPRVKSNDKNGSHGRLNFRESRIRFDPLHAVPEIGSDEVNAMNSDERYQVPVFDHFPGELYFSGDFDDRAAVPFEETETTTLRDTKDDQSEVPFDLNSLLILPSDMELAEFAADCKSLLGKSLEEQSFHIDALGTGVCRLNDSERVKIEEKIQWEVAESEMEMKMMREPFQLSLNYDSPVAWEEEDEINGENQIGVVKDEDEKCEVAIGDDHVNVLTENYTKKHTKMLKINYEGIIAAWDDDRSPWMTGCRPELDPTEFWPDCMGGGEDYQCGDPGKPSRLDGGREARVSRYREKRRTRLFSKKIRYEVRKLNAEKRPRMKGRFVKRPSFLAATSGFSLRCK